MFVYKYLNFYISDSQITNVQNKCTEVDDEYNGNIDKLSQYLIDHSVDSKQVDNIQQWLYDNHIDSTRLYMI